MKDTVSSNLQKKYDLAENPDEIEQLSRLSDSSEEPAVFAGNIGSLGSDGELDQGGSPYTPKAMKAHKTSFESGKAVNLNYFIANRGKVNLDAQYISGNSIKLEWIVSRDRNGVTVAQSEETEEMVIAPGAETGGIIALNAAKDEWEPGDYTVTIRFNTNRQIEEAYYLNNKEAVAHFSVTEKRELTEEEKLIATMLSEANKEDVNIATGKDDWTVAVYMGNAHIGSGTTETSGDLSEMLRADIPANVNLLVMTGVSDEGKQEPQIWIITDKTKKLLYTFDPGQDMKDGKAAEIFLKFAAEYAPAGHMVPVFCGDEKGLLQGSALTLDKAVEAANKYRMSIDDRWEKRTIWINIPSSYTVDWAINEPEESASLSFIRPVRILIPLSWIPCQKQD